MMDTQLPSQVEQRFCDAVLLWLAALIGLSLLPISAETIQSLRSVLIAGGQSALVIWIVRYAEPGELTSPSRIRTATFTVLGLAATALLTSPTRTTSVARRIRRDCRLSSAWRRR